MRDCMFSSWQEDRDRVKARRITLCSRELRPYRRRARDFAMTQFSGVFFCVKHQRPMTNCCNIGSPWKLKCKLNADDQRIAKRIKIGAAYAFLCGWDGKGVEPLKLIEEYAWRRRNQDDFIENMCKVVTVAIARRQCTLFDLLDSMSSFPPRDQQIAIMTVIENEKQEDIGEQLEISQKTVSTSLKTTTMKLNKIK